MYCTTNCVLCFPIIEHVVGMHLLVSSAKHLNETAVEEQILKPVSKAGLLLSVTGGHAHVTHCTH